MNNGAGRGGNYSFQHHLVNDGGGAFMGHRSCGSR